MIFIFEEHEYRECEVGFCPQQKCPLYSIRTLEAQENEETKLVAVFDVENFIAPMGRVSECSMKLEVIDDDYKRLFESPPTWHSNESILPDEIIVLDILRNASYKPILQIHITFDNENVSSLTGKPSEIIYKCPGEVNTKLIEKGLGLITRKILPFEHVLGFTCR